MSEIHSGPGKDMGAAFTGLLLGAVFIGAILYGIVLLTNSHFAKEKAAEKKTAVINSAAAQTI